MRIPFWVRWDVPARRQATLLSWAANNTARVHSAVFVFKCRARALRSLQRREQECRPTQTGQQASRPTA